MRSANHAHSTTTDTPLPENEPELVLGLTSEVINLGARFLRCLESDGHTADDTYFAAQQLAAAACRTPLDVAAKLTLALKFSISDDNSHLNFHSTVLLGAMSDLLTMTVTQAAEARK